jgi:hypothetical protein
MKTMACSDVDSNFDAPLLFIDGTDTTLDDPILRILQPPNGAGVFVGRFDGDNATFNGQCAAQGPHTVITFTRVHNDATSTTYRGRVVRVPGRDRVFIRGRFARTIPNALGEIAALATVAGDWETEKPT